MTGETDGKAVFAIPKPDRWTLAYSLCALVLGVWLGSFLSSLKIRDMARLVNYIYEKDARQRAERIISEAKAESKRILDGAEAAAQKSEKKD